MELGARSKIAGGWGKEMDMMERHQTHLPMRLHGNDKPEQCPSFIQLAYFCQ